MSLWVLRLVGVLLCRAGLPNFLFDSDNAASFGLVFIGVLWEVTGSPAGKGAY